MAYSTINTTKSPAQGGGKIVRVKKRGTLKNLLKLQVLIEDTSNFSPYYFNIIKKPEKLRLGGNIFEFSPPQARFKRDTQILFEPVDVNNRPIAYELLEQNSQSIRICLFITEDVPEGPAQITVVGEVVIDDCGCPIPEEWQGKPNVRWSESVGTEKGSVSPTIIYDKSPTGKLSETSIPWQYQTYEDVYDTNPGIPGTPYTVTGSYQSVYNSQSTGSNTGLVDYTRDTNIGLTPNPPGGQGTLQVVTGDMRFSSSMVGGTFYVEQGINNFSGLQPYPNLNYQTVPAYYATISAVINELTAQVQPAYIVQGDGGDISSYPARVFQTKTGFQLSWNETSASVSYTDPTAPSSSMTRVERTKEKATSYLDTVLFDTKPVCGVATHIDVFLKSDRTEGELTKITDFEIKPWNFLIDDQGQTDAGNTTQFEHIGVFEGNGGKINKYWTTGRSSDGDGFSDNPGADINNSVLINAAVVTDEFANKSAYDVTLHKNTSYFIEFNAACARNTQTNQSNLLKIDVYVSGKCVDPSNLQDPKETALGYYVGTIETEVSSGQFIKNSFEFKTQHAGSCNVKFKVRSGTWYLSNIKLLNCTDRPAITGVTPNHIRAIVPMPAITKFNDSYLVEFNYKNNAASSDKKTVFRNQQFLGNDPTSFIDTQPGSTTAIYNAIGAVTTSKSFYVTGSTYISNSLFVQQNAYITGNVFVEGNVYSAEYHTNIVSSSILFDEGDTIFGNSIDDIHITTGSIYVTSSLTEYITNNFNIIRPQGNNYIYINDAHITMSGDISSSDGRITSNEGYIRNYFYAHHIESTGSLEDDTRHVYIRPNLYVENNITASSNISSSDGRITGNEGYIRNYFYAHHIESTGSLDDSTRHVYIRPNLFVENHITASGNISASGTIFANTFESHGNTVIQINDNLHVVGMVTASRLSASINITTNHLTSSNFITTNLTASSITNTRLTSSFAEITNIFNTHFTSSNISASINIESNRLTASRFSVEYATATQLTASNANITHLTASSATGSFTGIHYGQGYLTGSLFGTASYGRDNDWYAQGGSTIASEPTLPGKIYHTGKVGIGDFSSNDIFHQLAVEGTTKLGNNTSNEHNITGSIHMKHSNMSIFSGSGRFGFGRAKPGTLSFDNSSARRIQIYDGDKTAVQLNVTNWETASAYIAGGGVIGANTLAARGPRASLSVNALNSVSSYGYSGTRGLAGGSFSYLPDTFEGNTNGDDIGDGGDTDSEGIRLLQEVLLISTGGNPQGSINLHARGDAGQQIRFFTGNDDARNTGGNGIETQRMTIHHDGGVGIGTHNPQRRLHVSNSIGYNTSHPIVRFETLPNSPAAANIVVVDSNGDLYQTGSFGETFKKTGQRFGNAGISGSLGVIGNIQGQNVVAETAFIPDANNGASLGTDALNFSDLFLADGGVINWNDGDTTLTHTESGLLTLDGATLEVKKVGSTADVGIRIDAGRSADFFIDRGTTSARGVIDFLTASSRKWRVGNAASGTEDFQIFGANNNEFIINRTSGNVGIRTTSPTKELSVTGTISASGNITAHGNIIATGSITATEISIANKVNLSYSENLDVDAGTEDIATIAHATFTAGFFDYVLKESGNMRAGTVMAVHDGINIELTDVSTADLGNTERVQFSASLDSTNLILQATVPSADWSIKTFVRGL